MHQCHYFSYCLCSKITRASYIINLGSSIMNSWIHCLGDLYTCRALRNSHPHKNQRTPGAHATLLGPIKAKGVYTPSEKSCMPSSPREYSYSFYLFSHSIMFPDLEDGKMGPTKSIATWNHGEWTGTGCSSGNLLTITGWNLRSSHWLSNHLANSHKFFYIFCNPLP